MYHVSVPWLLTLHLLPSAHGGMGRDGHKRAVALAIPPPPAPWETITWQPSPPPPAGRLSCASGGDCKGGQRVPKEWLHELRYRVAWHQYRMMHAFRGKLWYPSLMQAKRTHVKRLLRWCGANVIHPAQTLLGIQRNGTELLGMRTTHFEVLHMFNLHDKHGVCCNGW